jgi:hypothetical protein
MVVLFYLSLVSLFVTCRVLLCFTGLGKVASLDFGHHGDLFLCVYVYCHGDCLCLCRECLVC